MAKEIRLPKMGQTMEEGTIVRWLVEVGSEVKRGDVLCEVETDKATMEMDSPADGFIKAILVKADAVVAVDTPVAVVGAKDEVVSADFLSSLGTAPAEAPVAAAVPAAAPAPAAKPAATPAAAVSVPASVKPIMLEKMGQTMEEGTIVKSLVKVGDKVSRGDVIFEIETDKATMEMEATFDGFVKFVAVQEGQTLPVGNLLMVVAGEKDQVPQSYIDSLMGGAGAPQAQAAPAAPKAVAAPTAEKAAVKAGGHVFASPKARMLAKKLGVDLSTVAGSGPGGRIVAADIEKGGKAAPAGEVRLGARVPMTRLQKLTGERMLQSKREIPCFYLQVRADVTDLVAYREELKAKGTSVSYNDLIMKALAVAMVKYPIMTGQLAGDFIKLADNIGIGLAIAVPDGLVAPVVKDCDKKSLTAIAADSKALVDRARSGKLSVDDFAGGCISVSNLGSFGIESFIPIVVPGQCSILGVGQISDTLVPVRGDILNRKLMAMYLSVDHRIANGAYAAQFLDYFRKQLEDPAAFKTW